MVVVLTEKDVEGLYGSKSYPAPDLGDRKPKKTVSHVRKETMPARDGKPPREKIVLSFENEKKELVLNTTNYKYLCAKQPAPRRVGRCRDRSLRDRHQLWRASREGIRVKLLKLPEGIVRPTSSHRRR